MTCSLGENRDCKSVQPGSIPAEASGSAFRTPRRAVLAVADGPIQPFWTSYREPPERPAATTSHASSSAKRMTSEVQSSGMTGFV
jgi:hypothetical protein